MRTAGHEPHTGTRSADDAEKRVACGCSAAARQHCVQDQRSIPERRLCHAPHSEPASLRGLAGKLTREQLNEFQELLNRQNEDLYLDQDAADDFFISLDNDFHRLLYHDSGYDRIWEAMHNVTSHMDRVRYLDSALCRGNIASVQKEHEQIFGYLRDGLPLDVDVEALFEHHLGMYRENFQKILERFPDFFVRT